MRISQAQPLSPSPPETAHQNPFSSPRSYRSTLASLDRSLLKPASALQIFFEDVSLFFVNFFLWPIHGHLILSQQILLILMLPIALPFLIMEALVKGMLAIINICSCPFVTQIFSPRFDPREPTEAEANALRPWVRPDAQISEKQQLQLLHLLNTYFEFALNYRSNEIGGKENERFTSLIKIDIDSTSQLFYYSPTRFRPLDSYIDFIAKKAKTNSSIRFTFVGLDYSYFVGMLNMKVKTDVVKFQLRDAEMELQAKASGKPKSLFASIKSYIFNFFYRLLPFRPSIYDLQQDRDQHAVDFSLWPGTTRRLCADLINNSLRGAHLTEYHISLLDLENIIRT